MFHWAKTKGEKNIARISQLLTRELIQVWLVVLIASYALVALGNGPDHSPTLGGILENYIEETAAIGLPFSPVRVASANPPVGFVSLEQSVQPGMGGTANNQLNDVFLSSGSIDGNSLPPDNYSNSPIQTYTIRPGDNLTLIASDFGVSVNTIVLANNLKHIDNLQPGDEIKIPAVDGLIYQVKKGDTVAGIAKHYQADPAKIITLNDLPEDGRLQIGEELVIPDGVATVESKSIIGVRPNNQSRKADESIGITGTYDGVKLPSIYRRNVSIKRFAQLPDLGDYFILPATGYDWGIIHDWNGVDIANQCGTPIKAAAAGRVAIADNVGWNGGFGRYIKLIHDNGTETVYGHLSKILVSQGGGGGGGGTDLAQVAQGQIIGLMGSSGNSTGCHLHFEVHGAKNPLTK